MEPGTLVRTQPVAPLSCVVSIQWFVRAGREAAQSLLKQRKYKAIRLLAFLRAAGKNGSAFECVE